MPKNLLTMMPKLTWDEKALLHYLYEYKGEPNWVLLVPVAEACLYDRELILKYARRRLSGGYLALRWEAATKGLIEKIEADNEIPAGNHHATADSGGQATGAG